MFLISSLGATLLAKIPFLSVIANLFKGSGKWILAIVILLVIGWFGYQYFDAKLDARNALLNTLEQQNKHLEEAIAGKDKVIEGMSQQREIDKKSLQTYLEAEKASQERLQNLEDKLDSYASSVEESEHYSKEVPASEWDIIVGPTRGK